LWGAIFYAVAGVLTAHRKKNLVVGVILLNGTLFHLFLIINSYRNLEVFCPVCIGFLVAEIALIGLYYFIDREFKFDKIIAYGPTKALLVLSIFVFLTNPAEVIPEHMDRANAHTQDTVLKQVYEETGYQTPTKADISADAGNTAKENTDINLTGSPILEVFDKDGTPVKIDVSQKPALLFAWWCPHCDDMLREAAKYPPQEQPYLVAVFNKGSNNNQYIEEKLKMNGLSSQNYFIETSAPPIESVPAIIWWSEGKIKQTTSIPKLEQKRLLASAEITTGDNNGGRNANLAASFIDGSTVLPGAVFSFNQVVGERTAERGFLISKVITKTPDGTSAFTDGIGGGICRTSTVLHWLVQNAGLEVVESHRHTLPVAYGKEREDAAVAWPSWDYKFRNNTDKKLTIKAVISEEVLKLEIWVG